MSPPSHVGGGILQITLLPAFAQLALQELHIGDDVLYTLAGVAGQLFREVAQHFGCHEPAKMYEISRTPSLLNGRVDRLKCTEVGIGQVYVAAAVAPSRDGGCSQRARRRERRAPRPSIRECLPTEQPHREINQQPDDQKLQQGADRRAARGAVRGIPAMAEQPGPDQATSQAGQEGMALKKTATP